MVRLAADDLRRAALHRPCAGVGNVIVAAGHGMMGIVDHDLDRQARERIGARTQCPTSIRRPFALTPVRLAGGELRCRSARRATGFAPAASARSASDCGCAAPAPSSPAPFVVDQRFEDLAVLRGHLGDDMGLRCGEIKQRRVVHRLLFEEIDDVSIARAG